MTTIAELITEAAQLLRERAAAAPPPPLTVRREPDRIRMAAELVTLAQSLGAQAESTATGWRGPRCHYVAITAPGGLAVEVTLDGDTALGDTHVITWYTSTHGARLAPMFPRVNVSRTLATWYAEGWQGLRGAIERGLKAAASGAAYE